MQAHMGLSSATFDTLYRLSFLIYVYKGTLGVLNKP